MSVKQDKDALKYVPEELRDDCVAAMEATS